MAMVSNFALLTEGTSYIVCVAAYIYITQYVIDNLKELLYKSLMLSASCVGDNIQ